MLQREEKGKGKTTWCMVSFIAKNARVWLALLALGLKCQKYKFCHHKVIEYTSLFSTVHDITSSTISLNQDLSKFSEWAVQWWWGFVVKILVLWASSSENINIYIRILKNMYISRDLWLHKVKWSQSLVFLLEKFMLIRNIYSYIRLSFLLKKSVVFFVLQFYISSKSGVRSVVLCRSFFPKQITLWKQNFVVFLRMEYNI